MIDESCKKTGRFPGPSVTQLPLDLRHREALGREDYFVSDGNKIIVNWLDKWPEWPTHTLIIYGPKASGKTHLLSVWAEKSKAGVFDIKELLERGWESFSDYEHLAIDNIDAAIGDREKETELFHLYNDMKTRDGTLLLTSEKNISVSEFALPDLASRLRASTVASSGEPDDDLLPIVLLKLFKDKQLPVTNEVIQYIIPRIERSYKAIQTLVDETNKLSLSEKRSITIPLVRDVLENMNINQDELLPDTQTTA